jgi:rhamnogalacturonyl hydrolase YesR
MFKVLCSQPVWKRYFTGKYPGLRGLNSFIRDTLGLKYGGGGGTQNRQWAPQSATGSSPKRYAGRQSLNHKDGIVYLVKIYFAALTIGLAATAAAQVPAPSTPTEKMAATVVQQWPAAAHAGWNYEEGTLLDGLAAEWRATANGDDFNYIKASVDKLITDDGVIPGYKASGHTLDDIEMGRVVLLLYRVTQQAKYAKAAKFLEDQLVLQPRTASGGYWHKQIYPNQMWLDGAYMAEPFRAAYAATFQQPAEFDDIAKQFLLMDAHMRDEKSGLLHHGWDESKSMPWADKTTGLSPEVWARAMGWYVMALVDVLDWFPADHPQHAALVAALNRNIAAILKAQDSKSGLWWQVMSKPPHNGPGMQRQPDGSLRMGIEHTGEGNYLEASAACMFTYVIAKGVHMGYLPKADELNAMRAWSGIQKQFVTSSPDGTVVLHGTVKVGGLGGNPYRAGDFNYYIHEPVVDQDAKGVGAYLLAGAEMESTPVKFVEEVKASGQSDKGNKPTQEAAQPKSDQFNSKQYKSARQPSSDTPEPASAPKQPSSSSTHPEASCAHQGPSANRNVTALVDAWFNSQTRKNAFGQTELFHYKWNDDSNNGYSFFGRAFRRNGAVLATLPAAPTPAALCQAQVYIIASPDIPSKNPAPHYMDKASGDAVEAWVRGGGVLLLFSNDRDNTEFEHFNTLSDRFGIHFNPVLSHHVIDPDHSTGEVVIPPGTGIFGAGFTAYMKDTSTIAVSGAAKPLVIDHGDVMIAISHVGKGTVLAVTDPWFYNEYADGRKMGQYRGFEAADDVAAWAVSESRR